MTDTISVIDVAGLVAGRAPDRVAAEIGAACRGIGFFAITGHGIPAETTAQLFAEAQRFFAAPEATKRAVSIFASPHNRGYVGLGDERLDPGQPSDLKEAFNIGLELEPDDPELAAGVPFRGLNFWPDLPGWRAVMLDYFDRCWRVGLALHRGFAVDLGLEPDYFAPLFDRPMATLRLLHYPPRPAAVAPGQIGAGAHTDYGNVTILAVDGVPGLQVRTRDDTWIDASVIPGAFICNVGDCLMRWSNDVYVSTPHRVISPPGQERYTAAFFLDPNPEAIVACLPTCSDPDRPARYPPVTGAEFLKSRLDPTYEHRVGAG